VQACESAAAFVAQCGCGEVGRRGPCRSGDMGVGGSSGPGILLREDRGGGGGSGVFGLGPVPNHSSQTVAALQKRGVAPEFFPQAFRYDAERKVYVCPAGRDLTFESREKNEGSARYRYRAKLADCQGCSEKGQCCPQSQRRSLVRTEESPEMRRHREKMASESAREIYKHGRRLRNFPMLGSKRNLACASFVCAVCLRFGSRPCGLV